MKIHRQILMVGGSVLAVIVVMVAFVLIKAAQTRAARPGPARPASVLTDIATVPPATLIAVGAGTTFPGSVTSVPGPQAATGGKPEALYIGAQYSPQALAGNTWSQVAAALHGHFV